MAAPLSRREFIETAAVGAGLAALSGASAEEPAGAGKGAPPPRKFPPPVALSTWKHGQVASRAAVRILQVSGSTLDAVEHGINAVERDPRVDSVGVGGLPNEIGDVELDAAIMSGDLRCGAVMALRENATPISVARRVMESTRHIQLVGDGAFEFALAQGFPLTRLLTPESKKRWDEWRASKDRKVPGQVEEKEKEKEKAKRPGQGGKQSEGAHDTVATLVLDAHGAMAAGCSTSGLAWKMPGRVGDSPIIGAGLYCDQEVGAAGATGIGEEILRVCGSFLIVEGMRRGLGPQAAVDEALRRVARADPLNRKRQVAFIALSRSGEIGAGAMVVGFQAAVASGDGKELLIDVPPFAV